MRFQLALNVRDLDEAIDYYSRLFGVQVSKRKPGYANFAVPYPPLKLVLFEDPNASERLNHVGFETDDEAEVEAAIERLTPTGLVSSVQREEHCCYARKSTVYSHDPEGLMWEFYRKQGDEETFGAPAPAPSEGSQAGCCPTPA